MTERRFYFLAAVALAAMIAVTFLGQYFQSVSLLFDILLAFVGIVAGFLTNQYFAEKSEQQDLGRHASSGYRMSGDISNSLDDIIKHVKKLKGRVDESPKLSKKEVSLMFDVVAGQLVVLQRICLLANRQWQDVLPKEQLEIVDLSDERGVRIKTERYVREDLVFSSGNNS